METEINQNVWNRAWLAQSKLISPSNNEKK